MKQPKITDAEREVMEILWQEQPLLSSEVIQRLAPRGWSENTIRTLVTRLVKKGFVAYEPEGKRYHYRPLVNREDCLRQEKERFLERWDEAAGFSLVTQFVARTPLTPGQIEELQKLLEEKAHEPS